MNYKIFSKLFYEVKTYNDLEMYTCERGWEDWMNDYTEPCKIAEALEEIYNMAKMTLPEIREIYNLSRAEFCRIYKIPVRTAEDWERCDRVPEYVKCMICYTLFNAKSEGVENE